MQLIPFGGNYSAQVKASFENCQGLPFGLFVCFFVANQRLDFSREETAD
jgi:hypothetical protein